MIKLKDILKEAEQQPSNRLPNVLKKAFLEIISTYGTHREGLSRKSDVREIAERLGAIAEDRKSTRLNSSH